MFQVVHGVCFPYTFWPSLLFKSMFGVFLVLIEFLVPFFILVFCYWRIVWILHKRIDSSFDKSGSHIDKFYVARKNTLKTFLLIALCYIICWSSVQTYYLMYNLGYEADWDGVFFKCSLLMAFGNCTINPFIYFYLSTEIINKRWNPVFIVARDLIEKTWRKVVPVCRSLQ